MVIAVVVVDLNNLITAIGLLAAATTTVWRRHKISGKIDAVHRQVKNGTDSEGRTLREVVDQVERYNEQVMRFWEYQRTRNHDLAIAIDKLHKNVSDGNDIQLRSLTVLETISEQFKESGHEPSTSPPLSPTETTPD